MSLKSEKSTVLPKILVITLAFFGASQLFISSISSDEEEKTYAKQFNEEYNIFSLSAPVDITFCGEKVPTKEPEIFERLDREIHSNTYFHSNTILYFKRANRWFPVIEPILKANNIPDDFKYLALVESGLQNVVSPMGATGYWQFLEGTAKEYGLEVNDEIDERYHVEKATEAACKYLNDSYEKYNDWALVAASYNVGKGRIDSELERQQTNNYYDLLLNEETKRYVFRILAVKHILTHPEQYGFNIRKKDLYAPLEYKTVVLDSSVTNFADFAKSHNISYKILKHFNPWLRQAYLKNPRNKNYELKIPTQSEYFLNS
ncbi:MAG: murein transglycosylase [Flavobacteriales bacterium]|nr:murein transglycosylase [Flavobacteriales bacterium]|tara:strand:- start:10046 stop:10999 length:954 start_codon:yes stop_codon:yes gene_type:complete